MRGVPKRDVEALRERLKKRRERYVERMAECRRAQHQEFDVREATRWVYREMRYDARVAEIDVVLDTIKEWL